MLQLEIERPWLLACALLVPAVMIGIWRLAGWKKIIPWKKSIPWKKISPWKKSISRNDRKAPIRSLVFHCLISALLVLALSGVSIRWVNDDVVTVYVADLSDSIKSEKGAMQDFIMEAIQEMPPTEYAGIITFGADVALEQFVSDKKVFQKFSAVPSSSATNLEEALAAAMALFREDAAKRLVLLTDGYENAGSVENMVSSILGSQVDVKVVRFGREESGEVYISGLDIPEKISIGERFSVKVGITSNCSTTAQVSLYCGRTLKAREQVSLTSGENSFVFWDVQETGGFQTYRVVIEPEEDTETINNEYGAYTTIEAPPRILLVEGEMEERHSMGKASAFQSLLDAVSVDYRLVTPSGTPENINQLLEYRSVILLDVHADDLKAGFLNSIEPYVKDYAGGLIAIGGENSFALGNYKDTPLETVLPVYMDLRGEKEIPSIAFVMVIDQSGSMSAGNGAVSNLDLAKEAAIKALENLRPKDYIGVLSFSDSYTWVTKLTAADRHEEVKSDIAGIPLGGGTSIYPALKEAVNALSSQDAALKHVLLLTDGQDTQRDYADVLAEMETYGITLSTVAVGDDADINLLNTLAEKGGGRAYHTDLNSNLPRIFAQEVFLSVRSYLVNREFTPVIASGHEILSPLTGGMPAMYGYVAATKKEAATGLLLSDEKDPILTIWQYGLGKTVAFNSDGENKWTGSYAGWDPYAQLWKNLIDYTITETKIGGKTASVEQEAGRTVIRYETDEWDAGTVVTAVAVDENGKQVFQGNGQEIRLYPEAPGVYVGELEVSEPGVYSINVRQQDGEEVTYHQNTAYVLQYSQEYRFPENTGLLESFTELVQGTMIEEPKEVYTGDIVNRKTRKSLWLPLLLAAIILFMADVILRRLAINIHIGEKLQKYLQEQMENKFSKEARLRKRRQEETAQREKAINAAALKEKPPGGKTKSAAEAVRRLKQETMAGLVSESGSGTKAESGSHLKQETKTESVSVPETGFRTESAAPADKKAGRNAGKEDSAFRATQELLRRKQERDRK